MPTKPLVELCVLDANGEKCYCSITNTNEFSASEEMTYDNTLKLIQNGRFAEEKPLSYCHKAIAFRPVNWAILQDYMHDLQNYIKYRCK